MGHEVPGCIDYYPGWVAHPDRLLGVLQDQIAWEQHALTLYGRTMLTPRLTAWMGDGALPLFRHRERACPMAGSACGPAGATSPRAGCGLQFLPGQSLRDGTDSMGYHSDNESELGLRPTIASVSLGDRRRFLLRHRTTGARWSWDLGEGDLLVMRDELQSDYAHAVPKTSRPVGPRMNLTFRRFQQQP